MATSGVVVIGKQKITRPAKVATVVTYAGLTGVLAVLNVFADPNMRTGLPSWVEVFVAPMLPALIAFTASHRTKVMPPSEEIRNSDA